MSWFSAHSTITTALALLLSAIVVLLWLRRRLLDEGPPSDFPTQFVEVDGWRFRYHTSGRGPAVLLLHGIGANLFCWRLIAPLLAQRFTVYALDLPGFGQNSPRPNQRYGLDDQIPRLVSFMDQMQIERAFVVGNSMGGNVALWLTLKHPSRINGCAVIAPATSRKLIPIALRHLAWLSPPLSMLLTRQAMRWAHRRTVSKKDRVDSHRVEESFQTYGRNHESVRSFLLATDAIRDKRLPEALAQITRKVLVLWGSEDRLVSRQVIDELEHVLQSSESHVHIGGGHHLQEDEPDWVNSKITDFFTDKQD